MSKLLLITTLLFAFPSSKANHPRYLSFSCETLNVKAEIVQDSTSVPGAYRVTLKGEGGQAPYKYIFYKESGQLVSEDFDRTEYTGLTKGAYGCTIIDKKNCKKTIEIDIR